MIPYILLSIGTLGLLMGEFVIDFGRMVTLAFAALNLLGLVVLLTRPRKTGDN
jgi:hypothetical protein